MSQRTTYLVEGMTCGHCVDAVSAGILRLGGVRDVSVDLASGVVEIDSDAPLALSDVHGAVEEGGYRLVS